MVKQLAKLLLGLFVVGALNAYTTTKDGVTLSVVDYSKRPMTSFFWELPIECYVSLLNVNLFTWSYPVRFTIANNSDKTYKLGPNQIGGTISIDYEKIVKQLPIQIEGNGDYVATVLAASEGLTLGGLVAALAGAHDVDERDNSLIRYGLCDHIKHCKTMRILTGAAATLGTIGILSTIYAVAKAKRINAERRKWIKKNALPQEGIVIKPGEQAEVVVFLTHETYNRDHLMVSLIEPGLGNTLEPFTIPLAM